MLLVKKKLVKEGALRAIVTALRASIEAAAAPGAAAASARPSRSRIHGGTQVYFIRAAWALVVGPKPSEASEARAQLVDEGGIEVLVQAIVSNPVRANHLLRPFRCSLTFGFVWLCRSRSRSATTPAACCGSC